MFAQRVSPRRAFSRIDLLVVLFVGTFATGLLIPAIKRADEAAKKLQCAKNLGAIGIAAHNFHNDFNRLPSGYYGPVSANGGTNVSLEKAKDRGPWAGCLVPLLSYLQQNGLFKTLRQPPRTFPAPVGEASPWTLRPGDERNEHKAWWTEEENLGPLTGQVRLDVLLCPSDKEDELVSKGVLYTVHVANGKFQALVGPEVLGRTNYAGVAGAAGNFDNPMLKSDKLPDMLPLWIGIMHNRSSVTLGQVSAMDGTSNTLLFGESLGGSVAQGRDLAWSWFGVGAMGTAYGLGRSNVAATTEPGDIGAAPVMGKDGAAWYRFSSRHDKVVQFCFADGSVKGIRFGKTTTPNASKAGNNGSDWAVLQQLAGYRDGLSQDTSAILE